METYKSPLNDDRFEIVKTGNSYWPSISVVGGGVGGWAQGEATTIINHGLGFTPVIMAFVQERGFNTTWNFVTPSFSYGAFNTAFGGWINLQVATDSTNIYVITDLMVFGSTGTASIVGGPTGGFICQYYLMTERVRRV